MLTLDVVFGLDRPDGSVPVLHVDQVGAWGIIKPLVQPLPHVSTSR